MNSWKSDPSRKRLAWQTTGKGEFFYEQVMEEINSRAKPPVTILDIGCGGGFHHRTDLQTNIGERCQHFLGIEPDPSAKINPRFESIHQGEFKNTKIADRSVDIAYAVMVLEHVERPQEFFGELARVMAPGGTFFGFTVDARHWFSRASTLLERTHLKDAYLYMLQGERGVERYKNFPTAYLCNTPKDLERSLGQHFEVDCISLHKIGQLDYYFPKVLHGLGHLLDRVSVNGPFNGSCLAVRAQRKA
jgi:SAM-dependent methyltransferase